jgi:hypothetical protein
MWSYAGDLTHSAAINCDDLVSRANGWSTSQSRLQQRRRSRVHHRRFIAGSVSLVGFGLDSLIRGILSPFGENRLSAHRMRKVHHRPCGIAVLHVYHPVPSDEYFALRGSGMRAITCQREGLHALGAEIGKCHIVWHFLWPSLSRPFSPHFHLDQNLARLAFRPQVDGAEEEGGIVAGRTSPVEKPLVFSLRTGLLSMASGAIRRIGRRA